RFGAERRRRRRQLEESGLSLSSPGASRVRLGFPRQGKGIDSQNPPGSEEGYRRLIGNYRGDGAHKSRASAESGVREQGSFMLSTDDCRRDTLRGNKQNI